VQLRDCRHSDGASCNEAVAFAIDAAQKLGMQGESAHVCEIDDHGRFRYKGPIIGIIVRAGDTSQESRPAPPTFAEPK